MVQKLVEEGFPEIDSKQAMERLSNLGVTKKEIKTNPQLLLLAISAELHVLEFAVGVIKSEKKKKQ